MQFGTPCLHFRSSRSLRVFFLSFENILIKSIKMHFLECFKNTYIKKEHLSLYALVIQMPLFKINLLQYSFDTRIALENFPQHTFKKTFQLFSLTVHAFNISSFQSLCALKTHTVCCGIQYSSTSLAQQYVLSNSCNLLFWINNSFQTSCMCS